MVYVISSWLCGEKGRGFGRAGGREEGVGGREGRGGRKCGKCGKRTLPSSADTHTAAAIAL